jgi:UDP-N-acetyl-D-mannosaminuronate dehydrogenase
VLGFEVSTERVESLRKVYDQEDSRVSFTLAPKDLSRDTHFLVSVPTLLLEDKSINTSYIQIALTTIGRYARRGSTIVVESSVAVGMTRQLVGPLAKQKGFYAGMSPEVSNSTHPPGVLVCSTKFHRRGLILAEPNHLRREYRRSSLA